VSLQPPNFYANEGTSPWEASRLSSILPPITSGPGNTVATDDFRYYFFESSCERIVQTRKCPPAAGRAHPLTAAPRDVHRSARSLQGHVELFEGWS
jgi:hypothetical protein